MLAVATARLGRVACEAPLAALLRQRLQDCLLAGAVLEALQAESWPDMIICKISCCGRLSAGRLEPSSTVLRKGEYRV